MLSFECSRPQFLKTFNAQHSTLNVQVNRAIPSAIRSTFDVSFNLVLVLAVICGAVVTPGPASLPNTPLAPFAFNGKGSTRNEQREMKDEPLAALLTRARRIGAFHLLKSI